MRYIRGPHPAGAFACPRCDADAIPVAEVKPRGPFGWLARRLARLLAFELEEREMRAEWSLLHKIEHMIEDRIRAANAAGSTRPSPETGG